jgi:hypothetical protein
VKRVRIDKPEDPGAEMPEAEPAPAPAPAEPAIDGE